jgi:YVTN family beta-propeller protein
MILVFLITISLVHLHRNKNEYNISISGVLYVVNKKSSDISVFDLQQGKMITTIPVKIEPHEITILRNPNIVIVTNSGDKKSPGEQVTIINCKKHKIESTITLQGVLRPHGIAVIPQTREVAIVNDINSEVLIFNTASKKIEKKFSTTQKTSHLVVCHPTKKIVFTSNMGSNTVSAINSSTGEIIKTIDCQSNTEGIDINPKGNELWVTNAESNTIQVIETTNFKIIKTISSGKRPLRLKFSNDGKYCFVTNTEGGTISIFDSTKKISIATIKLPGNRNIIDKLLNHTPKPVGITMHPNGKYVFIANSNANKIEVIDIKKKKVVSRINVGEIPDGMIVI